MFKKTLMFLAIAGLFGLGASSGHAFDFGYLFGTGSEELQAAGSEPYHWRYDSPRHYIWITCWNLRKESLGGQSHLYSDDCTYSAWNKPRPKGMEMYQGGPDLEIRKGKKFFQPGPDADYFSFRDDAVHIVVKHESGKKAGLEIYANNKVEHLPLDFKSSGTFSR
ncbi:MAG: hypothetical protein IKI30_03255 [Oxalobacter sp.]|nr:hypothetical protein [Oxalobacter sp.]